MFHHHSPAHSLHWISLVCSSHLACRISIDGMNSTKSINASGQKRIVKRCLFLWGKIHPKKRHEHFMMFFTMGICCTAVSSWTTEDGSERCRNEVYWEDGVTTLYQSPALVCRQEHREDMGRHGKMGGSNASFLILNDAGEYDLLLMF